MYSHCKNVMNKCNTSTKSWRHAVCNFVSKSNVRGQYDEKMRQYVVMIHDLSRFEIEYFQGVDKLAKAKITEGGAIFKII